MEPARDVVKMMKSLPGFYTWKAKMPAEATRNDNWTKVEEDCWRAIQLDHSSVKLIFTWWLASFNVVIGLRWKRIPGELFRLTIVLSRSLAGIPSPSPILGLETLIGSFIDCIAHLRVFPSLSH